MIKRRRQIHAAGKSHRKRDFHSPFVTVDTVGAGEGEIVMWCGGSSSRATEMTTNKPVDATIIGIVDNVDILGKRVFTKGEA